MDLNPSQQFESYTLPTTYQKNPVKRKENPQEEEIVTGKSCWIQKTLHLRPVSRGCHIITDEVLQQLPDLGKIKVGLCHIQILHTSASLALNENWDPDVRKDMEMFLTKLVPEVLCYNKII